MNHGRNGNANKIISNQFRIYRILWIYAAIRNIVFTSSLDIK